MSRPVQQVSTEELYDVIAGASSQDPARVSHSAGRLKEMLEMPGTLDGLNVIATQRNVPSHIRQQSIIQFKNFGPSKFKMKRLLSDEQRANIRARSLSLLDEGDDVIADCNKVIIAKIARLDFPANWPSLITTLMSSINDNLAAFMSSGGSNPLATLSLRRSLEILNAVVKELALIKMPSGIRLTGQLVGDLHSALERHYSNLTSNFPSLLNPSLIIAPAAADAIQLAHLAYKCLCKMAVWLWHRQGMNSFKELQPWVERFFESSAIQLKTLSELRLSLFVARDTFHLQQPSNAYAARSLDYLTRHVRQFGKLFRRMQQLSASRFVALNVCSDLVLYYWSKVVQATNGPPESIADSQWVMFPVRFLVQALAIFKESLGQWSPQKSNASGNATLSKEFVEEAVKLLVTRFIPLNPKDLDAWLADPEEWVNVEDKENEQWEYELRPCGERVLMTFANQYEDYVTPLLEATFKQVVSLPIVDLESVVQREALYCALGRCAPRLRDVIPFQQWLQQGLATEARDPNPNFPIIKRRIAWMIGKWVANQCTPPSEDVWGVLIYLLSNRGPGTDAVVRYTAAAALRECVDSLEFDANIFLPHLPMAITQLLELSAEADTLETKTRVTQSLNVVIERMGLQIVPYMEMVAKPIPQLWTSAEGDFLYKAALLGTVTKLIESSKENSSPLNGIVVPLVRESFSNDASVHLDEDGLGLWKAALQNAGTLDTAGGCSLYELVPLAVSLLSENLDLLGSITTIIQSYFLLDARKVMQGYAVPLLSAFAKAIGQAVQTNQKDMIIALQLLVQLTPASLWAEPMHISGLFNILVTTIIEDDASTILLTEHICLFARMAIGDASILSQLVLATATTMSKPEPELWNGLLDQWWRRFDNMSEPRYRKLAAMGIACLVATGRPEVLERLNGEIINLWLDVFGEMKEALAEISQEQAGSSLSPLITFWRDRGSSLPSSLDGIQDTPEYGRWREIYSNDPVEREKLTIFVAQRMQRAQEVCGGLRAFEGTYLHDADPTVTKQLRDELSS